MLQVIEKIELNLGYTTWCIVALRDHQIHFLIKKLLYPMFANNIGRPMDHKRAGVMLYHFEYVYIINGN